MGETPLSGIWERYLQFKMQMNPALTSGWCACTATNCKSGWGRWCQFRQFVAARPRLSFADNPCKTPTPPP